MLVQVENVQMTKKIVKLSLVSVCYDDNLKDEDAKLVQQIVQNLKVRL